jgi:hypothetical protein
MEGRVFESVLEIRQIHSTVVCHVRKTDLLVRSIGFDALDDITEAGLIRVPGESISRPIAAYSSFEPAGTQT